MSALSSGAAQALQKRLNVNVSALTQLHKRVLVEPAHDAAIAPALRAVHNLVKKLLEHPRRKLIRKVGTGSFVKFEILVQSAKGPVWRGVRGLRPALRDCYYPNLSDEDQLPFASAARRYKAGVVKRPAAEQKVVAPVAGHKRGRDDTTAGQKREREDDVEPGGEKRQRIAGQYPQSSAPPKHKTNARFCHGYGTEHGALVHLQIQRFIESMIDGYRSPALNEVDPCVAALLETFKNEGWAPVVSEMMIFDEELRIGTQADVIVYDTVRACLRVVELTFGYEGVDFAHPLSDEDRFAKPLNMVRNSPVQRKMLQLLMTAEILRRRYGVKDVERALVRVCPRSHVVWKYDNVLWWDDPALINAAYRQLEC